VQYLRSLSLVFERERESKRLRRFVKNILSFVFTVSLFFTVHSSVYAATYYIGSTGSDSNTTTQAQSKSTPWLTLSKCGSAAASGDTCKILDNLSGTGYIGLFQNAAATKSLTFEADDSNNPPTISTSGSTAVIYDGPTTTSAGTTFTFNNLIFRITSASNIAVFYITDAGSNRAYIFNNVSFTNLGTSGRSIFADTLVGTTRDITCNNCTVNGADYPVRINNARSFNVNGGTYYGVSPLNLYNIGSLSIDNASISNTPSSSSSLINLLGMITSVSITRNNFTLSNISSWAVNSSDATSYFKSNDYLLIDHNIITGGTAGIRVVCDNSASPTYSVQQGTISNNTMTFTGSGTGIHVGALVDNNTGINSNPQRNMTITGNTITFNTRGNASHGMLIGSGTYNFTVEKNQINNAYWGLVIKGQNNAIRYNTSSATRALILKGNAKQNSIYNNTLYSTGNPAENNAYALGFRPLTTDGSTFTADSTTETLTSNGHNLTNGDQVYFTNAAGALPGGISLSINYYVVGKTTNTFQISTTSGGSALDITSNGSGTNSWHVYLSDAKQIPMLNVIKNNIIDQGLSTDYALTNVADGNEIPTPGTMFNTFDNNLYYGSTVASWDGTRATLTDLKNYWSGTTLNTNDQNSISNNPVFVSTSDFHLQSTSTAINAGLILGLSSDFAGTLVPQGTAPDIGAYEYLLPSSPTALAQYKSDGLTTITTGGSTSESSVVLKFSMTSSNSSDSLTPQVEVKEVGTDFNNSVTNSGNAVTYSGSAVTGMVTVSGLSWGKSYHWQARVSNSAGQGSWGSYGGNSETAVDFLRTESIGPTNLSLSFPSNYSKDNTRPTLTFKKATDADSGMSSYSVSLDSDKNRIFSTSGIPTNGNGTSNYVWKDDSTVNIEFLNENDSDSNNDEIKVYFKGLDNTELSEGKHTWTVTAYDVIGNSTSQLQDFYIDKTSPTISELAIANVSTVLSGVSYNLDITNRMPSFSGLATDNYLGSTVTNSNGTKDTFDKVCSGPQTITLTFKKQKGDKTYSEYLTKDYSLSDIQDKNGDKKSTRFYITTPFPLIDGYYKISIALKDGAENTYNQPDFYISLNAGSINPIQQLFTNNLETNVTKQETIPAVTQEEKQQVQEKGYTVKIKVVDDKNKPVAGAKVTIHSKVQETTTDKNGIAQFANVEQGDHKVLIAYGGYNGEQSINLTGDVKEFKFNIQVKQQSAFLNPQVIGVIGILVIVVGVMGLLLKKAKIKEAR